MTKKDAIKQLEDLHTIEHMRSLIFFATEADKIDWSNKSITRRHQTKQRALDRYWDLLNQMKHNRGSAYDMRSDVGTKVLAIRVIMEVL